MNLLSKDSRKIEEKEIYKDSYRTENCMKQRYLLAKLSLELKYRMLEIMNFIPDATIIVNKEGKVIAWNHAIEELTNTKAREILGKSNYEVSFLFFGEKRPMLANLILNSQGISSTQFSSLKKEGDTLTAEINVFKIKLAGLKLLLKAKPLYNLQGEIVGAIESIQVISISKEMEKKITT